MDGAIPLVMGLAGHRDLLERHHEWLEGAARAVFDDFAKVFPSTPLVLLSSLAEGAEQLAVKAALDFAEQSSTKVELIVPLPIEPEQYKKTFGSNTARCRFDALFERARRWFVVAGGGQGAPASHARAPQRAELFIARNCQVLLAFWDGRREPGDAVWEAVALQLEGPPEPIDRARSPLDLAETGPVLHVLTPHAKCPAVERVFCRQTLVPRDPARLQEPTLPDRLRAPLRHRFEPVWLARNATMLPEHSGSPSEGSENLAVAGANTYDRIFRRIETFNRDGALHAAWLDREQPQSKRSVIPDPLRSHLTAAACAELERYARADALANLNRVRMFRALCLLLMTAAIWSVLFYFQLFLANSRLRAWLTDGQYQFDHHLLQVLYLLAFGFGVLYWLWVQHVPDTLWEWERLRPRRFWQRFKADFHSKYLDYRALAEGLRVQLFWRICGIPDRVTDHYLRKQKSELEWVRHGVQEGQIVDGPPEARPGAPLAPEHTLTLAFARWVVEQKRYFSRVARWNHGRDRLMRAIGLGVLAVFFGLAWFRDPLGFHVMIALMTLVWVFGGLVAIYARVHAFSEHAKEFGWMSLLFDNARQRLRPLVYADMLLRRGRAARLCAIQGTNADRTSARARAFNHYRPLWESVFERLGTDPANSARRDEARALIHQEARALLVELGKDALAENATWVLLHRARAVELPQT